jgi:hypothetical protein
LENLPSLFSFPLAFIRSTVAPTAKHRRGGFFVFDPFALLRANAKDPQKNRYFSRAKVLILLYYYDIIL